MKQLAYNRLPRRPPFLRVLSLGMGVTSSVCQAVNNEVQMINTNQFFQFSFPILLKLAMLTVLLDQVSLFCTTNLQSSFCD